MLQLQPSEFTSINTIYINTAAMVSAHRFISSQQLHRHSESKNAPTPKKKHRSSSGVRDSTNETLKWFLLVKKPARSPSKSFWLFAETEHRVQMWIYRREAGETGANKQVVNLLCLYYLALFFFLLISFKSNSWWQKKKKKKIGEFCFDVCAEQRQFVGPGFSTSEFTAETFWSWRFKGSV